MVIFVMNHTRMRLPIVYLFLITAISAQAQNYSQLKVGNKWHFKMPDATYTRQVLKTTHRFDGKDYFQMKTKYSWGEVVIDYVRIDNEGNEVYLDTKSLTETINLPKKAELGQSWTSTDGAWRYEVFALGATFITPKDTYENCLVIKAEQQTARDEDKHQIYYNYRADGIGYIGSKTENGIISFLNKYKLK